MKEDICPLCQADLRGEPILPEHLKYYGNHTHYSRRMALYDRNRDMTVAYRCPDCGGEWPRPGIQPR